MRWSNSKSNGLREYVRVSLLGLALMSFGLFFISCSDNSQAGVTVTEEASVSGTLQNAQGEPIEGARVYAYQVALLRDSANAGYIAETTSDADGNYTLTGVENTVSLKFQESEQDLAAFREGLSVAEETQLDLIMRELKQMTISLPDYGEDDSQALISLDSQSTVAFLDGNLWVIHSVSGEDEVKLSDEETGSSLLVSQASGNVVTDGEEVGTVLDVRTVDVSAPAGSSSGVSSSSSAVSSSSDISSSSVNLSSIGFENPASCVELVNTAPQCNSITLAPAVALCPGEWIAVDTLNQTDALYQPDSLTLSFAFPEWTVQISANSAADEVTFYSCDLSRETSDIDLLEGTLNPGNIPYRLLMSGDILIETILTDANSNVWDTTGIYRIVYARFLD